MQQTAQLWLVYRITGSALHLSITSFTTFIPLLVLSPYAGVLVDRLDKKRLVLIAQVVFMILAALLAWVCFAEIVQFWHILILALLLGITDAFEKPARQSLLIELTGRNDLMNAIALHASVFNIARLVGPAIAGLIVARAGEAFTFVINAASFLPVIAGLLLIHTSSKEHSQITQNSIEQLKEGIRYVIGDRVTWILMGMVGIFGFFGLPYSTLMPIFAVDILKVGPEGLGVLYSASGIGAVIGGISLAIMSNSQKKGLLATIAMIVFSAALLIFSSSRHYALSLVTLSILGWAQVSTLATTNSLLQTLTPDALRGRVISIFLWMSGGALPIGALFLGNLAQHLGAAWAIFLHGVICGLAAIIIAWRLPQVRKLKDTIPV